MALELEIIQGPRKGYKFVYEPGSTIRIGRVVRGNNLTIKDSGISSKHLVIQHISENKWAVEDLDSSNGTTLNSSTKLTPSVPLDLADGDVIKLGEFTSIRVKKILKNVDNCGLQVQHSTRSRAVKKAESEEKSELESKGGEIVENRRGGRIRKARVSENVRSNTQSEGAWSEGTSELVSGGEEIVEKRRRGRPRKGRVLEKIPEIETISSVEEGEKSRSNDLENEKGKLKLVEIKKEVLEYEEVKNCGVVEQSGDSESENVNVEENKEEVLNLDLEKMTLGELFDYLEIALPLEIKAASEKCIEEIRNKAKQVEEYMMQANTTSMG